MLTTDAAVYLDRDCQCVFFISGETPVKHRRNTGETPARHRRKLRYRDPRDPVHRGEMQGYSVANRLATRRVGNISCGGDSSLAVVVHLLQLVV